MKSVAPMHEMIKTKRATIKTLRTRKNIDHAQIAGLSRSISSLENQASRYTEGYYNTRMLNIFRESFEKINHLSKHWKTLDEAMLDAKSNPRGDGWFMYLSPIDNTYMIVDKLRVDQFFLSKMKATSVDAEQRYKSGIFSDAQYDLLKKRLRNVETSFYSFIERRTIDVTGYVAPVRSEPLYPSMELLTEFHVCGRKKIYVMLDDAAKSAALNKLEVYLCVFCTGYHIGHSSGENDYRHMVGSTFFPRHRNTWKRYPEKAAAFLAERDIILE